MFKWILFPKLDLLSKMRQEVFMKKFGEIIMSKKLKISSEAWKKIQRYTILCCRGASLGLEKKTKSVEIQATAILQQKFKLKV